MKSQLEKAGLKYVRLPAVDGSTLSDDVKQAHQNETDIKMMPNEIGCLLSHIRAWEMLLESGEDYAVVMEDDVHLSKNLPALLEKLNFEPGSLAIIRLERPGKMAIDISRNPVSFIPPYRVHIVQGPSTNAGGYVINKYTARLLTERCKSCSVPIDIAMFRDARYNSGIAILQVIPAPIQQDHWVGGQVSFQAFKSAIGERDTVMERRFDRLKEFARPVFWFLLSIVWLPRGRVRKRIEFL